MYDPQIMNYIFAVNEIQHVLNESLVSSVVAAKTNDQERLDEVALEQMRERFTSLSVPVPCQRLHDDVAHLLVLHANVLRFVWESYAPFAQARYDYMEAITTVDVEIVRLVERYSV
jgi:hypothetical protein